MNNHTPDIPTKQCTTCGETFPATAEFWHKAKRGKYGLQAKCKGCRSEQVNKSKCEYQPPQDGVTKTCTQCGTEYPATTEYWHRHKGRRGGLTTWCKSCCHEYKLRYYEQNSDHVLNYCRVYYIDNTELILLRMREYYKANSDGRKEYQRKRYSENRVSIRLKQGKYEEAHREQARKRTQKWIRDNPDKARANSRNRRARLMQAEGSHTAAEVQEQYRRQRGKCYWCDDKLDKQGWHADHIIPLSRGGSNDISNIVCACPFCNLSKHDKLPHEWDGTDRLL